MSVCFWQKAVNACQSLVELVVKTNWGWLVPRFTIDNLLPVGPPLAGWNVQFMADAAGRLGRPGGVKPALIYPGWPGR